jgi:hypothetical protein
MTCQHRASHPGIGPVCHYCDGTATISTNGDEVKKGYPLNPVMRAAILAQLPADLPKGNKTPRPASPIIGARGQRLEKPIYPPNPGAEAAYAAAIIDPSAVLPPPGDTGEESISAQEEMRMACAWLMSLDESDAAAALAVIRTMREGYTP